MTQGTWSLRVWFAGVALMAAAAAATVGAADKTKVTSLDQLPRHSYAIEGTASALLSDRAAFADFAGRVRKDVEADLETFAIEDPSTLQGMYGTLLRLDLIAGNWDGALAWIEKIRALEDKPAQRLTTGLTSGCFAEARRAVGAHGALAELRAAFAERLAAKVAALPWEVVQDDIEETKGRAEIVSENLLLGVAAAQIDPAVAASGSVSADLARSLVSLRATIETTVLVKDEIVAVLSEAIAAHRVEKPDIWQGRAVELDPEGPYQPVVVGIWDSGVDVGVFAGRLWTNPEEKADGSDTDGNGFVDDVHGIAFDLDGARTPELLHPAGDMAGRIDEAMAFTKGFMDVEAALDSPEASALKRHLAQIQPADMNAFLEGLGFTALYMHGTHVAGIATAGNPFARVLVARISFDYHNPPRVLTVATARAHAASYADAVGYFKQHGVRVVNMSWGWSLKEVEGILEANGVGDTAEERTAATREIFGILKQGLHDALASAPDILFVIAAGNDDNDVEFDEVIPSNFELPNIVTVAAVDQAGDPTAFTASGRNVKLCANGYEVESYVPGGGRMAASGTSMAAPQLVNLVAKMLAVDPGLTPTRILAAVEANGDTRGDLVLLHPQRTLDDIRRQLATRASSKAVATD